MSYDYDEVRKTGGQLAYFFHNEKLRNLLTTEQGAQLIHLFGPFDTQRIHLYENMGSIPHAYEVLNHLKQSLGFNPEDIIHNFYLIETIERICKNESLSQRLFKPEIQDFYEKMREVYGYQFRLLQLEQFIDAAEDKDLTTTIFKPETAQFIKEFCVLGSGYYVFEGIQRFKRLDPDLRDLVSTLHKDFNFSIDYTFEEALPKLRLLKESAVMLPTAQMLREQGFSFNIIREFNKLEDLIGYGLEDAVIRQKGHPQLQRFIFENTKDLSKIPDEKLDSYLEVLMAIDDSPSQEIQRLRNSLLQEIIHTSDPTGTYRKIESVFIKNNLPTIGKVYKVFEILHTPDEIERKLVTGMRGSSPVLTGASRRRRQDIIYRDLMRIHIDSANRSLREYAELLKEGEPLMRHVDEAGIDSLAPQEQRQFQYLLDKFDTLFVNAALGKNADVSIAHNASLAERYADLKQSLGVQPNQNITERISQMFLRPVGLDSIDQMLERMKEKKHESHERGLQLALSATDGTLALHGGDFLKGVNDSFIANILQNGSVAKEYLGASSDSDDTPLDTDVARVEDQFATQGVKSTIEHSMASQYGNLFFALQNRDQFQLTHAGSKASYDPGKLELFETGGGQHYGIRTGFSSTQIDFIIARPTIAATPRSIEKVYYEIAQNGYYIPVTDEQGSIIFTPEMYGEYRHTFDGLKRFDGDPLVISRISESDPLFEFLQNTKEVKTGDKERVATLSAPIKKLVADILTERGTQLKEKFDTGLLGAELLDIGSTGRDTNMPGDADFDFTLKLDTKDFTNAADIAREVLSRMQFQQNDSHSEADGYYQLRAKGVTGIGDVTFEQPIDVDIGFTKKSDLSIFGSHDAIYEKLNWIAENEGEEVKDEVIANIVLTKQILKEAHAYKRVEHGGFGGIGVENWILGHEGNVRSAFRSFYEHAYENGQRIAFEEFKKKYKILNAGTNVKHLFHDNYIENIKPEGYEAMLNVIEKYLVRD